MEFMINVSVTGEAVKGKKKLNLDLKLWPRGNFEKKTKKVWTSKLFYDFKLIFKLLFLNCIYFVSEICV